MRKNKPYYAIILPIQGEIKNGDIVYLQRTLGEGYFPVLNNKVIVSKGVLEYPLDDVLNNISKLYICTDNIEIGDTVMEKNRNIEFEWTMMMDCNIPLEGRVFKVIGEVSTIGLNYVKEGNKYNEDDLRLEWKRSTSFRTELFPINQPPKPTSKKIKTGIVHVKGPCGCFH